MEEAIDEGNIDELRNLLNNGADVNLPIDGLRPLTIAKMRNNPDIFRFLVENGADVTHDDGRDTALMYAVYFNKELVQLVLDRGADVNQQAEGLNRLTALMAAASTGNHDMIRFLLEKGADKNLQTNDGIDAYYLAKEDCEDRISILKPQQGGRRRTRRHKRRGTRRSYTRTR